MTFHQKDETLIVEGWSCSDSGLSKSHKMTTCTFGSRLHWKKNNSRHTRTVTNHTSIPESVGWRKFFRTRSQAEGSNTFTKTNSCKAAVIERTLTLPESWAVCAQFTLVSGWHKYKQNKKSLYNVFSLQSNLLLIIDHVQTVQSSIPQSGLWPAFAPTRSIFYQ